MEGTKQKKTGERGKDKEEEKEDGDVCTCRRGRNIWREERGVKRRRVCSVEVTYFFQCYYLHY